MTEQDKKGRPPAAPPGGSRIDMHSHLLPGIDDGCADLEQSLAAVRHLIAAGYGGSICTPHIWPTVYTNAPDHIRAWTIQLQQQIRVAGLSYTVWPGGELRLFEGAVEWMKQHGVPTLADSKCVLVDFWEDEWPNWTGDCFRWLLDGGYQPILAHPERLRPMADLDEQLKQIAAMGVWFQGNFACMTGEEGIHADRRVRQFLRAGRYRFMALDMHRPATLEGRLDGVKLLEEEFGTEMLDRFIVEAPRKYILHGVA